MYFFSSIFLIDLYMLYKIQNKIAADDALFYAALLMLLCVNMYATFIYFHRNVMYIIFFIYHAQSLSLPLLKLIRKVDYPVFAEYFYDRSKLSGLTPQSIIDGATFIFFFDALLIFWLIFLPKFKPLFINDLRIKSIKIEYVPYILLALLFISIGSKLLLISVHAWTAGDMEDASNLPSWVNTVREFSRFDIVVYLIIGYYRQHKKHTPFMITMYNFFMLISLYFAFLTTSKAEIALIAIVIIYNKIFYSTKKDIIITLMVASFVGTALFPFNSYVKVHRKEAGGAIEAAKEYFLEGKMFEKKEEEYIPLEDDKFRRTDYFTVTCLTTKTFPKYKDFDDFQWLYYQNIIGLIPRMIWPGKPRMGIDTNEVGHKLGIIANDDLVTSIGLSPVGESWYLFGFSAIFITPLFMAVVLKSLAELFDQNKMLGRVLHYYVGLDFARRDTYLTVVTTALKPIIFITIIILFVNHIFPEEKDKDKNDRS